MHVKHRVAAFFFDVRLCTLGAGESPPIIAASSDPVLASVTRIRKKCTQMGIHRLSLSVFDKVLVYLVVSLRNKIIPTARMKITELLRNV